MNAAQKRGRPIHYNHGKCRNLVNGLAIESEAVRMQALNLIERAAQYWFEAAGATRKNLKNGIINGRNKTR